MVTGRLDRVAIVGATQTPFKASWADRQHVDLISNTVFDLLRGTGLDMKEVDFVIDSGSDVLDGRSISNCGFLGAMGAHHKEESRVEEDGVWALTYAVSKIAAGNAGVGLVLAYSKSSEADVELFYRAMAEPFIQRPVGVNHLVAAGLYADRYLREHDIAPDRLDAVSQRAWQAAANNPRLDLVGIAPLEDPSAAEVVADPLRRRDISRNVDGVVALIVARADIARRITPTPVWVTGMATSVDEHMIAQREATAFPACRFAADRALTAAGWSGTEAADLVEVSATSSVGELMVLEALGLAKPGRALDCYDAGDPRINPSGGALPADPIMATGLARVLECALRLTDPAPGSSPSRAVAHGTGGLGMQNHAVVTLEV